MDKLSTGYKHRDAMAIEQAYRYNPAAFRQWLGIVIGQHPDDDLLTTWHARLFFNETEFQDKNPAPVKNLLRYTVFISTIVWAMAKIHAFLTVDEDWFYPRFIPFLVIGALITYFTINAPFNKGLAIKSCIGLSLLFLILLILPDRHNSDSLIMALIHMPLVLISMLGFVFGGGRWRDIGSRLRFIRYGGELVIFTALVLLGGGVLTALTFGLFSLIDLSIEEWYAN